MNHNTIFYVLAFIFAVSIILCILKKVAKLIIFILLIFFVYTSVKGLMAGKTPIDIFNSTKSDAIYTKDLFNYSGKVKQAVQNSINAIDNRSITVLKQENKNLHKYLNEVVNLSYEDEMRAIHHKYCGYLKGIVSSSDMAVNTGNFTENTATSIQQANDRLGEYLKTLKGF
ncbi:hypothetical protein [Clostridium rectalis]|uniref:hypothetical protein n=1 Tax=Clostridium rectalis TaxID=2040295 RepID=UPI000F63D73B|nr:hypothetical protein [Clostridium rectalis]